MKCYIKHLQKAKMTYETKLVQSWWIREREREREREKDTSHQLFSLLYIFESESLSMSIATEALLSLRIPLSSPFSFFNGLLRSWGEVWTEVFALCLPTIGKALLVSLILPHTVHKVVPTRKDISLKWWSNDACMHKLAVLAVIIPCSGCTDKYTQSI